MVPRRQAVALALIINELVTNAFRHAEPPCRVILRDAGTTGFSLVVSDMVKGQKMVIAMVDWGAA
jgi:two-component sensor histidine kinase